MLLFYMLVATAFAASVLGFREESRCPDDTWVKAPDGTCLTWPQNQKSTFKNARAKCRELGGDLLRIPDRSMNKFARALVPKPAAVWIGARSKSRKGRFTYLDGTPLKFTKWGHGKPNKKGIGRHCVAVIGGPKEAWSNFQCKKRFAFLCQRDSTQVTTTTTTTTTTKAPVVKGNSKCEEGWQTTAGIGTCFQVVKSWSTFEEAKARCIQRGGALLTNLNKSQQTDALNGFLDKRKKFWIGASRKGHYGAFSFIDGSPMGEVKPMEGYSRCAVFQKGNIYPKRCSERYYSLCQKPLV